MAQPTLVKEILSYLMDHPDAQDTAEGIAEWWLLHQRAAHVDQALTELVREGILEEVLGADLRIHYRIPETMRSDIKKFISARLRRDSER